MKEIVCIQCPVGCRITVDETGGHVRVSGHSCTRGKKYAVEETTCPVRIVTCLVRLEGSPEPLSVRTISGIPKPMIADVVREIKALRLSLPVRSGNVVLHNVCGTGVDVIATKSLPSAP